MKIQTKVLSFFDPDSSKNIQEIQGLQGVIYRKCVLRNICNIRSTKDILKRVIMTTNLKDQKQQQLKLTRLTTTRKKYIKQIKKYNNQKSAARRLSYKKTEKMS